jgi:uncharacterized membrane protein YedE/YeeE
MSRLGLRPAAAALFGLAFGFLISWGQFADPNVIRRMLLLEDGYLWWMFMVAVAVSFVGIRLLRALRARALLTGEPVRWTVQRPERRHVAGAALFGLGWALSDACPGPVAAQLGQALVWSVFTTLGIGIGISLYLRRERKVATAPVAEPASAPSR